MKKKILGPLFFITAILNACSQNEIPQIDTLEFQIGYPISNSTAIQQLQAYPSPRYQPDNSFIRLFNWMNSKYMAGGGVPGMNEQYSIAVAAQIQEELALHWNYFITIQNSGMACASTSYDKPEQNLLKSYIDLANKYPKIPLALTTFWMQLSPRRVGLPEEIPYILRKDYPDNFYIKTLNGEIYDKKILHFAAPDSIFIKDGNVQKQCIENILSHLTRPLNFINENGEEPPGPQHIGLLNNDKDMVADIKKMGLTDFYTYAALKKTHMRKLYSDQFMNLPGLQNTWFSFYAVEGGPIHRFDWDISKRSCTKIKENYYSTPDFYPRKPDNWKTWKGAWHGWKWINDGRKVEIKSGDRFFSPFIAAGWDNDPEKDIRPGQWLGLLKCLGVVGAEFYYVGYFNLKHPFASPKNYVWQAAIPAYAQAITTHYADVFFEGNVLFDAAKKPIVTYPDTDDDVLVAVRKHNEKDKYVIATTVQPTSNTERFPLQKNIEITVAGQKLKINTRRQGSVYIYDKTVEPALFYQLDRWHQYQHPSRWRKTWINEAEVFGASSSPSNKIIRSVYLNENNEYNFVNAESFIQLNKQQWVEYSFSKRDAEHLNKKLYLMIYAKCTDPIQLTVTINGKDYLVNGKKSEKWEWITYPFDYELSEDKGETMRVSSLTNGVLIDKIIISDSSAIPDMNDY